MNSLDAYLAGPLTDALGWTIIHSLWQGMLIGLIVFIILGIRRGRSPQYTYLVRLMGLAGILASAVLTFLIEYHPLAPSPETAGLSGTLSGPEHLLQVTTVNSLAFSKLNAVSINNAIRPAFPWMTLIWILGVMVLSLRLAGGMMLTGRLRSQGVSPLPDRLEKRFRRLIHRSGIRRPVKLKLSGKVMVPLVTGVIRPLILLPAAIISLMPVDQLESILAHEIAHIRRYDFLVNIFQSVIEALFFYHPAVWILSEGVRRDREKCCDDFAVSVCGKLSTYARALAWLSEMHTRPVLPSVALTGKKNRLIIRVERLIKPKKMKTNAAEKIIAGMLILGSAIILTLSTGASLHPMQYGQGASLHFDLTSFGETELSPGEGSMAPYADLSEPGQRGAQQNQQDQQTVTSVPVSVPDTTKRNEYSGIRVKDNIVTREFINADGEALSMKFVIRGGEVEELYVNSEQVPESGFPEYQKEIDRTMMDLKGMERDLRNARQEISGINWEEMQKDLSEEMEHFSQQDMQKLQEELKQLQEKHIDMQIDQQKIQEEIRKAMEQTRFDQEKIREEMLNASEEARKAMEEFREGKYALTEEEFSKMEEAMKNIDFAEIERNVQKGLENLEKGKFRMEDKMKSLDEMFDELEKLELGEE
jgi:bla regulator protein BlaR1